MFTAHKHVILLGIEQRHWFIKRMCESALIQLFLRLILYFL